MFLYVIKSICCIFDIITRKYLILITRTGFLYFNVTFTLWFCVTEPRVIHAIIYTVDLLLCYYGDEQFIDLINKHFEIILISELPF